MVDRGMLEYLVDSETLIVCRGPGSFVACKLQCSQYITSHLPKNTTDYLYSFGRKMMAPDTSLNVTITTMTILVQQLM